MPIEVKYRPEVLQSLEDCARTCQHPKAPFMKGEGRDWSLPEVLEEIKARTEKGKEFYGAWESLYDKRRN